MDWECSTECIGDTRLPNSQPFRKGSENKEDRNKRKCVSNNPSSFRYLDVYAETNGNLKNV